MTAAIQQKKTITALPKGSKFYNLIRSRVEKRAVFLTVGDI